jgi:hypothetical protein
VLGHRAILAHAAAAAPVNGTSLRPAV